MLISTTSCAVCVHVVAVKWGKESYDLDVETSGADIFSSFQSQLFSVTYIPAERQKIMMKGKMIKNEEGMKGWKEGEKIMLMGTADPPPKEPEKKIVFLEDMKDSEKIGLVKVSDERGRGMRRLINATFLHAFPSSSHRMHSPLVSTISATHATWPLHCNVCVPCLS